MANENANGSNSTPANNAAGVKAPTVKRLKVPTVRPGVPSAQPAGQVQVPPQPQAKPQPRPQPKPQPQQAPAPQPQASPAAAAPAAIKAPNTTANEPELPPDSVDAAGNNIPRRRRKDNTQDSDDEKKEQILKAKLIALKVLSNIWFRLGVSCIFLTIICAGIYSSLPLIAEKKLPSLFASNGMPFNRFTIKTLTVDTMELTNVSDKTGTLSISSLKFNYSLLGLYTSNNIRSMTLSGVTINAEKRDDGISLGVLDDFIYSPVNAKKGKELTISTLTIERGSFVMKNNAPPETRINEYGEEEEIDNTLYINFTAKGSMSKAGLTMQVSTDYTTEQVVVKTETSLNKTAISSQIKTQIIEGVMKEKDSEGSVTGSFEIAVNNGVLSTGTADLLISSSSQKLKLNANVIPKESSFDLSLDLDRSFDDPKDAVGKFIGSLSLNAKDISVKGTFHSFEGTLPVQMKAASLTNGRLSLRDLDLDMNTQFSCTGMNCTLSLKKPMKFSFSSLQTDALLKKVKFFSPLELTINPDPKSPFLRSEGNILSFTLPISSFSTRIFLADNISNAQVATALNGLRALVKYNIFSGAYSGEAVFQQSGYADKDIRMTGVQGLVSFNSNNLPTAKLRVAKASLTNKNFLPDFSADLNLRPTKGGEYNIDSSLQFQNGLVSATLNGSYSLISHQGDMYLVVPKFILSEAGLKLSSVLPFLSQYFPDTTYGSVAAKGRIAFNNNTISGPINLLLENIETSWNGIKFEAINGVLTLASLSPLGTPENQQLFAGLISTGIPFQNALFNFQIQPNKGLEISSMRMKYANSQFKTIKSFSIPYEGQSSQILLEGNGIDLFLLSRHLKTSSLEVNGIMNSEWRLSLTPEKKIKIDQAVFKTKMPGTLHFTPSEELQAKMNPDMVKYLKDVIVNTMTITAKGQMDGPVSFDVSINGRSPLDDETNNQDVSFDFKSSFQNLLKQEGGLFEIPTDILLSLQNYSK